MFFLCFFSTYRNDCDYSRARKYITGDNIQNNTERMEPVFVSQFETDWIIHSRLCRSVAVVANMVRYKQAEHFLAARILFHAGFPDGSNAKLRSEVQNSH